MESVTLNLSDYQLQLALDNVDGQHMVALKPVCTALGIAWTGQRLRTLNNPQFKCVAIDTVDLQGRIYPMLCIPLCQVGMWICTINAKRVSEHIKPKLLAFQEQLQFVIHSYLSGRLTPEILQRLESSLQSMQVQLTEINRKYEYLDQKYECLNQKHQEVLEENAEIKAQLRATNILDRTLVSNAGRQLAAQKAALRSIN